MNTKNVTVFFKGIAIFMIILCHSHQIFLLPASLNKIFSFFQIGVQLFMILSAMGLCFSYSKQPLSWFGFMKKRLFKLAVLFWFSIALAAVYRIAYAFVMHKNIIQEINFPGIIVNALFLHGLVPDATINNHIVRGGWFIGSIVILYAFFPIMYRIYFYKNKVWEKLRLYLFPFGAFVISSILIIAPFRNFEIYEKTLLQLAPFSLGFPLFELQKNNKLNIVKYPLITGIVFSVIAAIFYFTETYVMDFYVFSIALAFFFLIIFVMKNLKNESFANSNSALLKFFNAMGEYSFPIYLTHSYIVFDFCFVATAILSRIYPSDLLWFVLLQPFVIGLSYYLSKIFETVVNFIVSKFIRVKKLK